VSGTLEGVTVDASDLFSPLFPQNGPFFTHFQRFVNDTDPHFPLDVGVFGGSPSPIAGTYDFRQRDSSLTPTAGPGLSAGNTITVNAANAQPLDPIVNVIANTQFTLLGQRQLNVLTNGSITLTQGAGNLPVGSLVSTAGDVTLVSPQANLDGLVFSPGPNTNVPAMNVTLTAGNIAINTGNGNDEVDVESSLVAVAINLGTGTDLVNIAPVGQNLDQVTGNVTITGGTGVDTLNVDDQNGGGTYALSSTSLSRDKDGVISYSSIAFVNLFGGNGGPGQVPTSKYTINGTEPGATTQVQTGSAGTGDATVNVNATSLNSTLDILLLNSTDTVNIAPVGQDLDSIAGNVTVTAGQGTHTLNMFDQNGGVNYNFSSTSLSRGSDGVISYNFVDFVNLSVPGGLSLQAQRTGDTLVVNDNGAAPDRTRVVTITPTGFTRTQPGSPTTSFSITGFQNEVFNVSGTTNVQGTAAGTSTTINVTNVLGHASLPVTLGQLDPTNGQGTLQTIKGPVTIAGPGGNPQANPDVLLNDFNDTQPHTVSISSNQITGLTDQAAPINLTEATIRVVEIIGSRSTGGSTYTINGTPASDLLSVVTPGAADVVTVLATDPGIPGNGTTHTAIASPTVFVGKGSLQAIQGAVEIVNAEVAQFAPFQNFPTADVQVDDSNDTQPQTVTIGPGGITRQSTPAGPIDVFAGSIANLTYLGGVSTGSSYTIAGSPDTNTLILSAPGPDTVNVQATSAGTTTTIQAGSGGGHTINVGSSNDTSGTLDGILGLLNIVSSNNTDSPDKLNIFDEGSTTHHTYNITRNAPTGTFTRSTPNPVTINFSSIMQLNTLEGA
jgi:hypothetical protein